MGCLLNIINRMVSLVKKRNLSPISNHVSELDIKRHCKGIDTYETITIPNTPIDKLKASFPSFENQILEQALIYCHMDLKSASMMLQQKLFLPYAESIEEVKFDAPLKKTTQKTDLIQLYLEKMNKVQTQEEAIQTTKILLNRYKNIIKPKNNSIEEDKMKNDALKKGMRNLLKQFDDLYNSLQSEQKKISDTVKKVNEMKNEIENCKLVSNELVNRIKELDNQEVS